MLQNIDEAFAFQRHLKAASGKMGRYVLKRIQDVLQRSQTDIVRHASLREDFDVHHAEQPTKPGPSVTGGIGEGQRSP